MDFNHDYGLVHKEHTELYSIPAIANLKVALIEFANLPESDLTKFIDFGNNRRSDTDITSKIIAYVAKQICDTRHSLDKKKPKAVNPRSNASKMALVQSSNASFQTANNNPYSVNNPKQRTSRSTSRSRNANSPNQFRPVQKQSQSDIDHLNNRLSSTSIGASNGQPPNNLTFEDDDYEN